MPRTNLQRRATWALAVVAISLFLLLCLANFGLSGFTTASEVPWHLWAAGLLVDVFGAGAYVLVLLPLVWGVVVYFEERTPALVTRAVGTLLLATSIAMVTGLLHGAAPGVWAGALGAFAVWLVDAFGGVVGPPASQALIWTGTVALFVGSLIVATDWMFHTLRRGPPALPSIGSRTIATEPMSAQFREPDEYMPRAREFIPAETASTAAMMAELPVEEASPEIEIHVTEQETIFELDDEVPSGFSMQEEEGRMVLRGPSGYAGVEFLPPSDELADLHHPEQLVASDDIAFTPTELVDDEFDEFEVALDEILAETEQPAEPRLPETGTGTGTETGTESGTEPGTGSETGTEFDLEVEAGSAPEREMEPLPTAATDLAAADEPERPRTGIGVPEFSPFVDEFFPLQPIAAVDATDGASSAAEVEATYGTAPDAEPIMPEPELEPQPPVYASGSIELPEPDPVPTIYSEEITEDVFDEVFEASAASVSLAATPTAPLFDDELPSKIEERRTSAPPAPAADRTLDPRTPGLRRPHETAGRENAAGLDRLLGMELDPLFREAVDAVLARGRGSVMVLQRHLGIGHGRGVRLLRQMRDGGLLGPEDASGSHEVRVSRQAWETFVGGRTA